MNSETTERHREECSKLPEDISYIVGFVRKQGEPREVLAVLNPDEVDRISFSPLSFNNPARIVMDLMKSNGKIAVIAKGCDARTLKQLEKEEKIERERLFIIGISCPGVVDYRKFRKAVKFRLPQIESVELVGDEIVVKANGEEQRIPFSDVVFENCLHCEQPTPKDYDVLIGEPRDGGDDFSDIEEFEKLSKEERWSYWMDVFSKCIRCHACRQVCPLCYCEECLVDPSNLAVSPMTTAEEKAAYPRVLGKTVNAADNMIYHLTRVLHHAGRCSGCGECERACPMELPLLKLERKLKKVVYEVFNYSPDEEIPFLSKLDILPEG